MLPKLTDTEARIIGCLMEKSVTTPDQYPLTLNALTNACNQKSAREPVMAVTPAEVQRACRELADRSLLHIEENFKNGTEKYKQRVCNTTFNELKFDAGEFAIMTLLLLRGPQTPGELRARASRLHTFADNDAVVGAASGLIDAENAEDSVVVQLPRTPGRKNAEFMHQLCGPVELQAHAQTAATHRAATGASGERIAELEARVAELEEENVALKTRLADPT